MEIVRKLPRNVSLSKRLRERAPFFLLVQSLGISYYIAATPNVRRLLELDAKGMPNKPDRRMSWRAHDKADALRDVVASLELQVRDVVLAGIEESVTNSLLDEMRQAMRPKVRGLIEVQAAQAEPKLLKQ